MAENSIIAHGGMFRCCIATILELPPEAEKDGAVVECKYACGGKVRFNKEHWEAVLQDLNGDLRLYEQPYVCTVALNGPSEERTL